MYIPYVHRNLNYRYQQDLQRSNSLVQEAKPSSRDLKPASKEAPVPTEPVITHRRCRYKTTQHHHNCQMWAVTH